MNSRVAVIKQSVSYFFSLLFWLPVILLSLLLVYNTIPYFSFSPNFSFIQERIQLYQTSAWKVCFYTHIFAGMWCITTACFQFSSYILKKRRAIHRWAGKVYVFVVLVLGAPTGLYMSFFAKGGVAERVLFTFMAMSWFYFTLKGYETIRKGNVLAHRFWMIRSYTMALTAVTFRVYQIFFFFGGMEQHKNYAVSLWISVVGNLLLAETVIFIKSKSYLKSFAI
jgi:hypothetical protein